MPSKVSFTFIISIDFYEIILTTKYLTYAQLANFQNEIYILRRDNESRYEEINQTAHLIAKILFLKDCHKDNFFIVSLPELN